jgi:glycosyltransferase involved in cell wall biosynthesis
VTLTAAVENGVDVASFDRRVSKRRFLLQLGRVCPEKGQHLALQAAHAADADLLIAGEVFPYADHRAYFEREVAPGLDAHRRWIGPVAGDRKRRLLAAATAVLIPSLAAETSSLVAREAAAAGTPVIAFRSGALVDAVEHGRTGFLVDDSAGMADATARARFPLSRMTDGYLDLYRRLIAT